MNEDRDKDFFLRIDGYKTEDAIYFWNERSDNTSAVVIPADLNLLQYEMETVKLKAKNNTYNSGKNFYDIIKKTVKTFMHGFRDHLLKSSVQLYNIQYTEITQHVEKTQCSIVLNKSYSLSDTHNYIKVEMIYIYIYICNIYNMSGRVVSDIQTRAEGEWLYI